MAYDVISQLPSRRADNGIWRGGDDGKGKKLGVGFGISPRVVEACQRHDGFIFPPETVPGMRGFGKILFIRLKKMGCGDDAPLARYCAFIRRIQTQ